MVVARTVGPQADATATPPESCWLAVEACPDVAPRTVLDMELPATPRLQSAFSGFCVGHVARQSPSLSQGRSASSTY